ncbi:MAG: PIN domain-containing protein [Patescibacteria group bacterium]|nr:PIN domain-containing protein [Patescibacteria group bacterium]
MTELLDTNVILRFLVKDNEKQYQQAVVWFKEAEKGKREIEINSVIIAEACFVLESFYKKTKKEISLSLEAFLSYKWLKVKERETLLNLWPWYLQGFHFVDSYLLAFGKANNEKILSFDKKLMKMAGK